MKRSVSMQADLGSFNELAQHKRGFFRRKVTIANMLSWTKVQYVHGEMRVCITVTCVCLDILFLFSFPFPIICINFGFLFVMFV